MEFFSKSDQQTILLGKKLGAYLKPGDLILLYGELGAGKTTFIKGLCLGLGVPEETKVVSPTFSLVNIYEGRHTIFHVDLYRLAEEEVWDLGLWENLSEGIVIIEWANRLSYLPSHLEPLFVTFEYLDFNLRRIIFEGSEGWFYILKELERDEELRKEESP